MLEDIETNKHEWKIFEFSKLGESCFSKEFSVGDYKWKIRIYPNGVCCQRDQSISIYLTSVDAEGFGCRKRVKAKVTLSVKDQISGEHHKKVFSNWFSAVDDSLGLHAFMPLHEFKDPKRGFLVKDCCIVEADVSLSLVLSMA
uniref:MATH domain and coiled-coil domain-containing protein At3g58200-like n=1 Tax=Nicotiana tabacum TaxID=4097 RepID=A0A1S3XNT1_TOBAC|nr:PREDICTED: MATH domain and coiled-coil domain-containing protein At3g58200-like [Nicotiana tabacum]XP_033514028.1 MATH domain and coiled-coil domain-containing protein At3g58200-like [Nicotiana tomentosiformis]